MMHVFKTTSLLLALRMRQISIPLVFLEFIFFQLKSDFLQAHTILENRRSLVEIGNRTSECAPIEQPGIRITNKIMEKSAVASKQLYFFFVFFISHHIRSPSGCLENPVSLLYQWMTFSTIDCGIQGLSASICDALSVI